MLRVLRLFIPLLFLTGFFFVPTFVRAEEKGDCTYWCKDKQGQNTRREEKNACQVGQGCADICDKECKKKNSTCDESFCGVASDPPKNDAPQSGQGGESSGILQLPPCATSDGPDAGNCGLDDVVKMGVNFANFLLGLSGAIFLGIFVYAGLLYLLSGGDSTWAKKGKDMMKSAVIGMLIIFGAGVIVRFIHSAFTRQTPGPTACEKTPGYSCQILGGSKEEIEQRGCKASKQGGDSLCGGTNVYCCPIDPPEKTK